MLNVVPPPRLTKYKFKKKPTEADIGRLRISSLRILVELSSNKKEYLEGINAVTEADTGRLCISFLRIQVRCSPLQEGHEFKQNEYKQMEILQLNNRNANRSFTHTISSQRLT